MTEASDAVPPGRYAKGVIKREAILDAALGVFGQVGFEGATLREIARQVGVSHQSLMHYFPTKQDLLIAVLRRRDERLRRHFNDPAGMAVAELISLAEYNAGVPGHIELFSIAAAEATAPNHPGHEYYTQFYENIVGSTATFLRAAQRKGMLKPGVEPEAAARIVLALVDGLQLQWLYDPESVEVAPLVRSVLESLLTVDLEELNKLGNE